MRRNIFCAIFIALFAVILGSSPANADPPVVPNFIPLLAGKIVPDTANCGTLDLHMQFSCASALANEFLDTVPEVSGAKPNYLSIGPFQAALTQIGLAPDYSVIACAYFGEILSNHYCNTTVHLSEGKLDVLRQMIDDPELAIAIIVFHEVGHFVESTNGGVNLTPIAFDARALPYEQWADCFAGAATAYFVARGFFPSNAGDKGVELFGKASEDGDPSHGTAQMRQIAYGKGFVGGVAACGDRHIGMN